MAEVKKIGRHAYERLTGEEAQRVNANNSPHATLLYGDFA
jgi:hypothetical protein